MANRHKFKRGGMVAYSGGSSNVAKEAASNANFKRGGKCEMKVGGAAPKSRIKKARGGSCDSSPMSSAGGGKASTSPFSSAHKG
jgi:hypothetical protein